MNEWLRRSAQTEELELYQYKNKNAEYISQQWRTGIIPVEERNAENISEEYEELGLYQ